MKRTLMISACAFAPALFIASAASADCRQDLRNVANIDDRAAQDSGFSSSQIRRIRQAARILARTGHEDACQEIVAVLEDVGGAGSQAGGDGTKQSSKRRQARQDDGQQQRSRNRQQASNQQADEGRYENPERLQMANNAQPVLDQDGNFSISDLMGATVYSASTGQSVGEIEDLVMGGNQQQVVLGHGGFLGMGEKRIKLSLQDLLVNQNDNSYYIEMSDRELKREPAVEKEDGRWVQAQSDDEASDQPMRKANRQQSNRQDGGSDDGWLTADSGDDGQAQRQGRQTARADKDMQKSRDDQMRDRNQQQAQAQDRDQREGAQSQNRRLTEAKSNFSVNRLVGQTIYSSSSGDSVGEIEDLVLALGNGDHSVILSHGGFLGLGEKRVKLKLSDIRYDANQEKYFVALTDEQLKSKPGLRKVDGEWTSQSVDADRQRSQNAN